MPSFVFIFELPPGVTTDEAVERLGEAQCTDAHVGVGVPGRIALAFDSDGHPDGEAFCRHAVARVIAAIPGARQL